MARFKRTRGGSRQHHRAALGNHGDDLGAQLRRKFAPETSYDHPTSYGGTCQRIIFITFRFELIPRCTRKQRSSFAFFQKHTTALTYINETAVTPLILGHSQMTAPVPTGAIPRMGQPGDLLMS